MTSYSIDDKCGPFIDGFSELQEAYRPSAFHDSVLANIEYKFFNDGYSSTILLSLSIDGEIEITLKFIGVHCININLPDIRCAYFYSVDFYVAKWSDYGECIVMETDGDLLEIIADKIIVLSNE